MLFRNKLRCSSLLIFNSGFAFGSVLSSSRVTPIDSFKRFCGSEMIVFCLIGLVRPIAVANAVGS